MLELVSFAPKDVNDYRPIVGDARIDEILAYAAPLKGARVLHLNATGYGGGVAELLGAVVPLMKSVGLDAEWRVMAGAPELWEATKAIHNLLQGAFLAPTSIPAPIPSRRRNGGAARAIEASWTAGMADVWRRYNQITAERFDRSYDFVVVHDPQPAGVRAFLLDRAPNLASGQWIWRCHIDLTKARPDMWEFLRPYLEPYHASIFTMQEYVKPDVPTPEIALIAPAIDPLSTKNVDLPDAAVRDILRRFDVDPDRPMLVQVSRFDPWKDPLGVVDVYKKLKKDFPGLQLVMAGSMATDDPEGFRYFELTARRAGEDRDVHLLTNLNGVGNVEINAFQRAATVVLQKSIREGFALTVSEALWKGRPVVATAVGGIPLQVASGVTGYLVTTTRECVERTRQLLCDPVIADEFGINGRERVRENFVTPRLLSDYMQLFGRLSPSGSGQASALSASLSLR